MIQSSVGDRDTQNTVFSLRNFRGPPYCCNAPLYQLAPPLFYFEKTRDIVKVSFFVITHLQFPIAHLPMSPMNN